MKNMDFWLIVGFIGQIIFGLRFLIQWISSEKRKESYVPEIFWYLSLIGGLTLLVYATYKGDPVFILGQAMGSLVYLRNLILISRKKKEAAGSISPADL
jgi:lipid-A-disaccharide synthase-like uncharacterized protein